MSVDFTVDKVLETIPVRLASVVKGEHKGKTVCIIIREHGLCCVDLGESEQHKLAIVRECDLRAWRSIRSFKVDTSGNVEIEEL